jgi:uncharacterized protein YlxW (UPF0749 family)
VRAGRFLAPLLAGVTILLLVCNVVPASTRRHRLQEEHLELVRELRREQARSEQLAAEIEALQNDPFVLERALIETWNEAPEGAMEWDDSWAEE